uniref:uncharacterized protein LOC122598476 n=1 Tax=Erigeron canadensis TaxID=72917 RepID=UPI001CB8BB9F|nr:uncharacterized protein LOC122598476 [Erigeron canadensis]
MPQESLRSVVYRSFVTCEDPRGVVEGKTIRISKTDTTKMSSRKAENKTQPKSSKEKEKMSLVEVKNGAQKLNQAIDSWSNGTSFRGQPKDIAKDLLKGALDLQESLMMLGKLQESSYMTNLKKKQEKLGEDLSDRLDQGRFESFRSYDSGYQKERKLANGSSRDCYSELRDVIREGLSKQNLLPNKAYQESALAGRDTDALAGKRTLQSSPDIASTSSSRSSSMIYSTHEFTSSDSFSSRATEEKPKRSNLIAKLMGLDQFPSKLLPSSPPKQLEVTSKMRPAFDVDLPNAKKPQFLGQKMDREHGQRMDREHMSLDEIIVMMQSKGLLRSNKHVIKQTSKSLTEETPPIVLMRPHRLGPDNQNVKVYDNPMRKLHQEKAKAEDISVKTRGKMKLPSNKQKASALVVTKPQRNQEVVKKIDKIQKIAPPVRRSIVEKAKSASLASKNDSLKEVKIQRSVSPNSITKRISSSALSTNKSSNQKKIMKIEKPTLSHKVVQINMPDQENTLESEVTIREHDNVRQQSLSEAFEKSLDHVTDAVPSMDHFEARNDHGESGVFDVIERKEKILKTISSFQDSEPANFELFQDCVNELLEHENQRQNPFLRCILPSRVCTSEGHMMTEIAKGVENLVNYSKFSNESSNADTISRILERDLYLSTNGGVWTAGWTDGCTVNEVEEAVLDLEKMVLSKLIDDILIELVSRGRFVQKT